MERYEEVAASTPPIRVDPLARTADLDGRVTFAEVIERTLPYGLAPWVVPAPTCVPVQVAASGLGAGSSSFRQGTVGEWLDLPSPPAPAPPGPTSAGAAPAGAVRMALGPLRPYVHLRHLHLRSPAALVATLDELRAGGCWDDEEVSFVEGLVLGPGGTVLTLGSWAGHAPFASLYRWGREYRRSVRSRSEDYLTVGDYLRRWDTRGPLPRVAAAVGRVGRGWRAGPGPGGADVEVSLEHLADPRMAPPGHPLRFSPLRGTPGQAGTAAIHLGWRQAAPAATGVPASCPAGPSTEPPTGAMAGLVDERSVRHTDVRAAGERQSSRGGAAG